LAREGGKHDPLPPTLDPNPDLTTCVALDPVFPTTVDFVGTLAADPDGSAAALCRDGPVFFGTREGSRWKVDIESDGAVLGSCGPTCVARSRTFVWGDVSFDPTGPTSFDGALVEQLTRSAGDCGACLPCAARYTLTGTVMEPP
jgi:hypothetical protein